MLNDDQLLRVQSLELAVGSLPHREIEDVVDAAEKFYTFLKQRTITKE